MSAGIRHTTAIVGAVLMSATLVMAQAPPIPNSVADLFQPVVPTVSASDLCVDDNGGCGFGTYHHVWIGRHISTDALGSVYLLPQPFFQIGECVIGSYSIQLYRTDVYRVTSTGTVERLGAFEDRCEGTYARRLGVNGEGVDAINGVLYLEIRATNLDGMFDRESRIITKISGLPTIHDVVPAGPEGPQGPTGAQGPVGPTGPQGPPGPLLTPCPDADADGFRDCVTIPGCFPYGGACGDCNDADPTINPRGSERTPKSNRTDGKDNDCNGVVDG